MNPILLYYQAKAFMELKLYNYALIMAKYACDLSPESTSTWTLLSRAYINVKNYRYVRTMLKKQALLAIDTSPIYSNEPGNDLPHKKHLERLPINRQKKVPTADAFGKLLILPKVVDFELSKTGDSLEKKTLAVREDKEQMNLLSQLSASWFSESEMDVYKNLSLMEKRIGWEGLIQLRDQLFVKSKTNDWDNPKIAAECIKAEEKTERPLRDTFSIEIIQVKGTRKSL